MPFASQDTFVAQRNFAKIRKYLGDQTGVLFFHEEHVDRLVQGNMAEPDPEINVSKLQIKNC